MEKWRLPLNLQKDAVLHRVVPLKYRTASEKIYDLSIAETDTLFLARALKSFAD